MKRSPQYKVVNKKKNVSVDRRSLKKSPKYKKETNKKSPSPKKLSKSLKKRKVKTQYRMRGMGCMFSMYGGATEAMEKDYDNLKKEMKELVYEYKRVNQMMTGDKQKKKDEIAIRKKIDKTKLKLVDAKDRLKNLLKNASETATKAASALSDGIKTVGSKLSDGYGSIKQSINKSKSVDSLDSLDSLDSRNVSINSLNSVDSSDSISSTRSDSSNRSTNSLDTGDESSFFRD